MGIFRKTHTSEKLDPQTEITARSDELVAQGTEAAEARNAQLTTHLDEQLADHRARVREQLAGDIALREAALPAELRVGHQVIEAFDQATAPQPRTEDPHTF